MLHYLDTDERACLARIHDRNERRPDGVYFGAVTDGQVAEVNRYFVPPSREEGFNVVAHRTDDEQV